MGSNKGFQVERNIVSNLNNKRFFKLATEYKELICMLFKRIKDENSSILCIKNEGTGLEKKNDLTVTFEEQIINISVKSGSANSIHQEKIQTFINFLESKKLLNDYKKNLIYEFHWCDGTYDNTGDVKDRMSKTDYKKNNQDKFLQYMGILREYKKEIFYRIFMGTENIPDFTVYFSNNQFFVINFKDLFCKHMEFDESDSNIGILTIQNWNACLQGQDLNGKKHRNDVQFKCKDFQRYLVE
jgi:hypothetical protein